MNCGFSRRTLALHVGGDLSRPDSVATDTHLATCSDCRDFVASLRERQALLTSLRRDMVSPPECVEMRRQVMAIVTDQRRLGWLWRVERFLALGLQHRPDAIAALVLLGVLSVTMFGQVRTRRLEATSAVAEFDDRGALQRPLGYRDWTVLQRPAERIYVAPQAHRARARTGRFPEGTVIVWEPAMRSGTAERHHDGASLLVSVKNSSRFAGGWGFFDFTASDGRVASTAQPLPESSGCRTCHRPDDEAERDPRFSSPLL